MANGGMKARFVRRSWRGSNPRRPHPREQGMSALTTRNQHEIVYVVCAAGCCHDMSEIPSHVHFPTFEIKKVSNVQLHSVRYEFEDMVYFKLAAIAATMFTSFTLSPTGVVQYKRLLQPDFISVMKDGTM
jgi:hypothetical protein